MHSKSNSTRVTLGQGLDKEVYSIVLKFLDQHNDKPVATTSVSTIYGYIKGSNSSLKRKSKKLLEDSITRVLDVIEQDAATDDDMGSISGDYDGVGSADINPTDDMNKNIVDMWSGKVAKEKVMHPSAAENHVPQATNPTSKRRQMNGEPPPKRRKAAQTVDHSPPTHISLEDIGGAREVIEELTDLIALPLRRPEIFVASKFQPTRGVLLHGPPGCGKTILANAFAAEMKVPFISISAPTIVSGMSGESEKALRDHFEEAKKVAPCLVFIDEIDAITPKRDTAQREMEKRIVAQLLTCMDDLALEKTGGKAVVILAATNRPDSLDPALRRGGRFNKEINLGVPSEAVREKILRALTRQLKLSEHFPFREFANRTPGFVGADLNDLVLTAEAAALKKYVHTLKGESDSLEVPDSNTIEVDDSVNRDLEPILALRRLVQNTEEPASTEETNITLTAEDFYSALPKIQPSAKREGFATIPETTWTDIGALEGVRQELLTAMVEPMRKPQAYARVGITAPTGILLWGPPGCGKTLLAKAVANESRANFISVKGPELLNKYVGESERAIRQVFHRARSSVPCVIFFDELDALTPTRHDSLSESTARVVNTLLTELDGLSRRTGIYVIAATNRADIIDPAMLRPGRLETKLFVDLPGPDDRAEILQTHIRNRSITCAETEAISQIARDCKGFSGADLESLLRKAGEAAVKRDDSIQLEDFAKAKEKVQPSVRPTDMVRYEEQKREWGTGL